MRQDTHKKILIALKIILAAALAITVYGVCVKTFSLPVRKQTGSAIGLLSIFIVLAFGLLLVRIAIRPFGSIFLKIAVLFLLIHILVSMLICKVVIEALRF